VYVEFADPSTANYVKERLDRSYLTTTKIAVRAYFCPSEGHLQDDDIKHDEDEEEEEMPLTQSLSYVPPDHTIGQKYQGNALPKGNRWFSEDPNNLRHMITDLLEEVPDEVKDEMSVRHTPEYQPNPRSNPANPRQFEQPFRKFPEPRSNQKEAKSPYLNSGDWNTQASSLYPPPNHVYPQYHYATIHPQPAFYGPPVPQGQFPPQFSNMERYPNRYPIKNSQAPYDIDNRSWASYDSFYSEQEQFGLRGPQHIYPQGERPGPIVRANPAQFDPRQAFQTGKPSKQPVRPIEERKSDSSKKSENSDSITESDYSTISNTQKNQLKTIQATHRSQAISHFARERLGEPSNNS
jgi:hypothetical protein